MNIPKAKNWVKSLRKAYLDCGNKRKSLFFFGVSRVFFSWRKFFFFGCKSRKLFFLGVSRVWGKKPFFPKKKTRRRNTRTTQQLPLLPEEVKHIAPTDMLGTSGTGKAMEPWREGWFLYSSPADGGNNVEHTHHDRKQKMQFALRPLASGIKMTILLPAPPATKLKPAIPPESGHQGCP